MKCLTFHTLFFRLLKCIIRVMIKSGRSNLDPYPVLVCYMWKHLDSPPVATLPRPDAQVECSSESPLTAEDISPACCEASLESSTGLAFCWRTTLGTAARNARPVCPASFDRAELLPQPGYSSMWYMPPGMETMKRQQRAYNPLKFFMKFGGWNFWPVHTKNNNWFTTINKTSVLSWQLSEDFSMVMDMTMWMYLVLVEYFCNTAELLQSLVIVVVVDYCCCCCKQRTGTCYCQSIWRYMVLWIFKTYCCCTYSIKNNL